MIIIGSNNYALIAAQACLDSEEEVVLVLSHDEQVTPSSLIFDDDLGGAVLPSEITIGGHKHTFIEPDILFKALLENDFVAVIAAKSMIMALDMISVIKDMTSQTEVVFTDALPQICTNPEHEFRSVKTWETIMNTGVEVPEAVLLTNSDFRQYPWLSCVSIRDIIVKLYPEKPPIQGVKEYNVPVSTTCTCHNNGSFTKIGPEANWSAQIPRESVYPTVASMARKLNSQEAMF